MSLLVFGIFLRYISLFLHILLSIFRYLVLLVFFSISSCQIKVRKLCIVWVVYWLSDVVCVCAVRVYGYYICVVSKSMSY